MLISKSLILSCLLFGAAQALAEPKDDKPTDHPHLAKRSKANDDAPTNDPKLAERKIVVTDRRLARRTVKTDHHKLARRTIDNPPPNPTH
ncbi:hypothetical protein FMUND_14163 [Fusarium mundagurra]|uniref:RxLR effector protein n=1 Tax=Fusarium mundagurra TaxID=1567541 RepID=A0A8H6D2F6_9HYPO|nr:hypothetical protein FMUND_14163 [Fusarium mundagurra]